jgi:hypothetical protein
LPTSSVTLTGAGTETGGTISSYAWSQVSGPSTATIATSTQAQTAVSGLTVAGTYVFQLKVTDANGATASAQVSVVVNPAISSGSTTTTYQAIPGTIQGESYASMSGVATETTTDAGGGLDVGWISKGDWMSYNLNVASAGTYTVSFRVASALAGPSFKMQDAKGNVLATVNVPTTGAWQAWTTITATMTLPAGAQTLTIVSLTDNGWNLNWMQFALQTSTAPVTSGKAIPGTIQAENYDMMIGVRTETTSDVGGGQDVSYLNSPGNQVGYNVTVAAAGTYTATFRVSSPNTNATFNVMDAKNNVLATVTAPYTGGWQIWGNVSANVTLPAGAQTIRIVCPSYSGFNFNWMQFATQTTTATAISGPVTTSSVTSIQPTDPASAALSGHISVYPNPAGDQVNLEISNSVMGSISVNVIDAMGVTVKRYQYSKEATLMQQTLSLNGLPTGLYFIRMQSAGWTETRKILKK